MYSIDRIEGNIVVLQNLDNESLIYLDKDDIIGEIYDGAIVDLVDGKYIVNKDKYEERKKSILEKFNRLKEEDK